MGRWEPNARDRLERAALELYAELGFEQTTAKQIAQRAGLTERTFFRHFTDKREVLFPGNEQLATALEQAVADAPRDLSPIEAVCEAFGSLADLMEERRDLARQRQAVIATHVDLQERELAKVNAWSRALAHALTERDVAPTTARLTAEAGLGVFKVAFEEWITPEQPPAGLRQGITDALGVLRESLA
ncbi:TetR family transcriptional regulator [Streptomyces sp. SID8379]|uniref:TetR/AcrR family transcriptional regulator n=1 Tax=unclassified Streptomyces TaxID=2593676 RepID=UPI0004769A06|nr:MULTISPECIES: TetR family transcriptional regulator [unclassified Streptomyces]MYW63135.1 TetR family transcriptional regulator [Streptomyces sp. SID8379]